MKVLIRFCIMASLFVTCSLAQDLEGLHRSFMTKYDQINTNRDAKIETLTEGYLGALDRLKKQLQTTGQLELVLQAQNEIDLINKDIWPFEDLGDKAIADLKSLRAKYVESRLKVQKEHSTQLAEIVDKMEKLLATQIVDLTKAGKIEEAKLAQKMKDDLAKDAGIAEAKSEQAKNATETSLGWVPLPYDSYEVKSQKSYYVGPLIGKRGKGVEDPLCIAEVKKYASDDKNVFMMIPNCEVEFTAKKSFTEFRGEVILTRVAGSASIQIIAAGKTIHKSDLKGGAEKAQSISCKFPSVNKITVICDDNGTNGNDSVGWVSMEVR